MRVEFIGSPGSGKTAIARALVRADSRVIARRAAACRALVARSGVWTRTLLRLCCSAAERAGGRFESTFDALADPHGRTALQGLLTREDALRRWYNLSMIALMDRLGSDGRQGDPARHANVTRHFLLVAAQSALVAEWQMGLQANRRRLVVIDESLSHNTPTAAVAQYAQSVMAHGLHVIHVETPDEVIIARLASRYGSSAKTWPAVPVLSEIPQEVARHRTNAEAKRDVLRREGIPLLVVDGSLPLPDVAKSIQGFLA